jgi:nicotinate phosphoribosyltransferase
MVETEDAAGRRFPIKLSQDKQTLPGAKQVFRYADHDLVGRANECPEQDGESEALLRPVILGGRLIEPLPGIDLARKHAAESLARLPAPCVSLFEGRDTWRVETSRELATLYANVRQEAAAP